MNRTRRIILHAGINKTASSSIQETLFSSTQLLSDKNYYYPKSIDRNHSVFFYNLFSKNAENYHFNIRHACNLEVYKKETEEKFLREVNTTDKDLMFSGEDISKLTASELNNLQTYLYKIFGNDIDIKVIIYVRETVSWNASAYQQRVRSGTTSEGAFSQLQKESLDFYERKLGPFIKTFEKKNMVIVKFEEAIKNAYGPVGHFLSLAGFNNCEVEQFKIEKSNESLSDQCIKLHEYINEKKPLFVDGKLNKGRFDGDLYPINSIRGYKYKMPIKWGAELLKSSQKDREWLRTNCGIDYLNSSPAHPDAFQNDTLEITKEAIDDIKDVISSLNCELQELVLAYLEENQKKKTIHEIITQVSNCISTEYKRLFPSHTK